MSHSSSGGGRGGEEEPRVGARFGGDEVGTTPAASDTTPAEEHLFHLVEMGFAEDQALAALLDAHRNLGQALDTLSTQTGQVRRARKSCTPNAQECAACRHLFQSRTLWNPRKYCHPLKQYLHGWLTLYKPRNDSQDPGWSSCPASRCVTWTSRLSSVENIKQTGW